MNAIEKIFTFLSDKELKETLLEIMEDNVRNDGIILSKKHREICKRVSAINNQSASVNLLLVATSIYKEACKRFISLWQHTTIT